MSRFDDWSVDFGNYSSVKLNTDLLLNSAELFGNILIMCILRHRHHGEILNYLRFYTFSLKLEASVNKMCMLMAVIDAYIMNMSR